MKTIGLIGGMSWESSAEYYRIINEEVKEKLGGLHSARCVLFSVDFHEIERCQSQEEWQKAGVMLAEAALSLEKAGADFIVVCTNTMHKVTAHIKKEIQIPIIHIADATAESIITLDIKTVGLLGTAYTMEQDFYKSRVEANGIDVIVPKKKDRDIINKIIFDELCLGKIKSSSKEYYKTVIERLLADGAEGIILGCTEIGLLIHPEDVGVPLFDTTIIHAKKAVELALEK